MTSTVDGDRSLPADIIDVAERLTRLAREAVDEEEAKAYRDDRDDLLTSHGYRARIRDADRGDVLVLYPSDWLEDGLVDVEAVDDRSRAVERLLSGPGDGEDWDAIDAHNREIAATVGDRHGEPHGATARALADFASNHYAKPIEALTRAERREFREEYLPRNAWPSDDQRHAAATSVELAVAVATETE